MRSVKLRRVAACCVLVLAVTACMGTLPPEAGRNQQLWASSGSKLEAALMSIKFMNSAAEIACANETPNHLSREACLSIDKVGGELEIIVHKSGDALDAAQRGTLTAELPSLLLDLTMKSLEYAEELSKRGVKWQSR